MVSQIFGYILQDMWSFVNSDLVCVKCSIYLRYLAIADRGGSNMLHRWVLLSPQESLPLSRVVYIKLFRAVQYARYHYV